MLRAERVNQCVIARRVGIDAHLYAVWDCARGEQADNRVCRDSDDNIAGSRRSRASRKDRGLGHFSLTSRL